MNQKELYWDKDILEIEKSYYQTLIQVKQEFLESRRQEFEQGLKNLYSM